MVPPHDDQSRTRGFLFADLRGYTAYVEAHGDHAGAALLERYRALVRSAVAAAHGAEIKTEGDSFYVVFDSTSAAVRCGQEIIAAADASDTDDPIRVGVGVHAGETVETTDGFVGSAVNIAARICAQAKAGELVVSDTVRALTRTYLAVEFEPLGSRHLKGVNEQIALYRVVPRAAATRVRPQRVGRRRQPWLPAAGIGAVAVVVLAVGSFIATGGSGGAPTESPSRSAQASAGSTAAASTVSSAEPSAGASPGSALTLAEENLKARIPKDFQPYCHRSSTTQGALGGSAMLQCDLPVDSTPEYAADTVWYDAFDQPGTMVSATNALRDREKLVNGTCTTGKTGVIGTWSMGYTYDGTLACYARDDGTWILWTYRGDNIAARAVRRDRDVSTLFSWWKEYGAILRG